MYRVLPLYTEHTITIKDYSWQTINMEEKETQWVYPAHCAVLEYQIEPKLGSWQVMVLDSREGDRPYLKNEDLKAPFSSGASAIAMIGGGTGRCQEMETIRYASSSLYFEPQKEIEWRLSFPFMDREKLEMVVY